MDPRKANVRYLDGMMHNNTLHCGRMYKDLMGTISYRVTIHDTCKQIDFKCISKIQMQKQYD